MENAFSVEGAIDKELAYFLPHTKGQSLRWIKDSDRQLQYAQCCRHGMNKVAQAVAQSLAKGKLPDVETLYKIAARVRLETATLMQNPKKEWPLYGLPHGAWIMDPIAPADNSALGKRWGEFYPAAHAAFNRLWNSATDNPQAGEALYGPGVKLVSGSNRGGQHFVSIVKIGAYEMGQILYDPYNKRVSLSHMHLKDQSRAFADADRMLSCAYEALKSGKESEFWEHFAELGLQLFHIAPCRLGSQTVTLMVMGGIQKALGYEVIPLKPRTDHFMDAEIIPHKEYIGTFMERFEGKPPKPLPERGNKELFKVDARFFEKRGIDACWKKRGNVFIGNTAPHLLEHVMGNLWRSKIKIERMEILPDKRVFIRVEPQSAQAYAEKFVDWVGGELLEKAFGCSQVKNAARGV